MYFYFYILYVFAKFNMIIKLINIKNQKQYSYSMFFFMIENSIMKNVMWDH